MPEAASHQAQIDALRAHGAEGFDPVGLRFIEALARRAAGRDGSLRAHYRHRAHDDPFLYPGLTDLSTWVDFTAVAEAADATGAGRDDAAAQAAGPDRCSPLAELLAHIEAHAMDSAEGVATPPGVPGELKSVRQFRRTWSRLNADRQLSRALDQAPENAGPLNSHHLVLQTLKQMRAISPEYVEQFISWVDALLWLEQADAGRGSATKSAPAGEAAKKRKPTRRKGG